MRYTPWEGSPLKCPGVRTDPGDDYTGPLVTRVYLQHATHPRKLLDRGCDHVRAPGSLIADAPTISRGFVTWEHVSLTSPFEGDVQLRRRSLRTGATTRIPIPTRYYSLAADGRTLYAVADSYRIITAQLP